METTGGVDKDVVIPLVFRQADTVLCNFDRVALSGFVYRDTGVLADHLQLLDGGGTVDVTGNQQGPVAFALQLLGDLRTVCGFTGTLETDHHDDCRRVLRFREAGLRAAHEFREFFVDDLDDHLCRRQAGHDLSADGPFRDFRREVLCDFVADVRFE